LGFLEAGWAGFEESSGDTVISWLTGLGSEGGGVMAERAGAGGLA
jgi:hypothetical protein